MGANAQTSVPAFTSGQVLTASQVTQINTGIPVFASSTERDAAFGGAGEKTLAEGQYAFLEDTNETQVYDGSAWAAVGGGGGKILQVVTATSTTTESTTSSTYVDTSLTATITPSSTSSKILALVSVSMAVEKNASYNTGSAHHAIERDGSQLLESKVRSYSNLGTGFRTLHTQVTLVYLDSPASTSATVYTLQHKQSESGTVYSFIGGTNGTLTLLEVAS